MPSAEYYKVALLSIISTKLLFPEQPVLYHIITGIILGIVAEIQSSRGKTNEN